MSVERWGFESGNNGDVVNATNGSADSLLNTGGTATISTAQAAHGTRSALFTGTSANGVLYLSKAITATTNLGMDAYIYVTSAPDAETTFLWIGAGTTREISLGMTTARQLRIRDAGGGGGASLWTSTAVISLNTWTRISMVASQSATTGTVRAGFFAADATTATEDSGLLTNKNTGANPYNTIRVGVKNTTGTNQVTAYIDDWAFDSEAVALLPPYGATPPTLGTPTVDYDMAYIDMSGTTFTIGPGIFSVTPSSGAYGTSGGVVVPRDPDGDVTTFVVTATDTNTGASANVNVNVDGVSPFVRGQSESVVWNGTAWV